MSENPNDRLSEISKKLFEGFTVTCDKCGSNLVVTESDRGYSPESGGWGSLDLVLYEMRQPLRNRGRVMP